MFEQENFIWSGFLKIVFKKKIIGVLLVAF